MTTILEQRAGTAATSRAASGGPVIHVRDLRKRRGDVTAVDGVSFEVRAGAVFGLLGPMAVRRSGRGLARRVLRDRVADVPLAVTAEA